MAAPTVPSIRVEIQSPYQGGTKVWSNRWFLSGPDWANQTQFNTLADNYTAAMKTYLPSWSTIINAIGYNAGTDTPVFSKAYSLAGTLADGGNPRAPLETCLLVRFSTDQRSTKNHPIYLFKYIHSAIHNGVSGADTPLSGQKSTLGGIMSDFIAGKSDGTNTRVLKGPRGATALGYVVETYFSHHDFPR